MNSGSKRQCTSPSCADVPFERPPPVGLVVAGEEDSHFDPFRASYEKPMRILAISKLLSSAYPELHAAVHRIEPREVLDCEILSLHTKPYLNKLGRMAKLALDHFDCNNQAQEEFESIYMNKNSLMAAKLSAGSALECLNYVMSFNKEQSASAAAAIRPPGHHAEAHCAMGFCFFNNCALVVQQALQRYGMRRVLIIDFDIHHGNSTQRMFLGEERVLYFSIHRWDRGRFYPANGKEASAETAGAFGKTVNVAFSDAEMGDLEYRAVVDFLLLPLVREFMPELVVFSAGFDVLHGDPIGKYHVSPRALACLVRQTLRAATTSTNAAGVKTVLLLEGGYSTTATAEGFCACLEALHQEQTANGDRALDWPEFTLWHRVKQQAVDAINLTITTHCKYWPSLKLVQHSQVDGGKTLAPAAIL